MLKIGDKVRDKKYPSFTGVIDDIDYSYKRIGRIYYCVLFDQPSPISYLWYQEKDLEVLCEDSIQLMTP